MSSTQDIEVTGGRTASRRGSRWHLFWGVLLIAAGALAVLMPLVAALATVLVLGWLLILGGAFEFADAVQGHGRKGWRFASAILTLAAGVAILVAPLAGVAALALLLGAFLLAGGIVRALFAFQLRPLRGWGWVLADAVLSIILGVLILVGWPESSVPIIGLLAGLWLAFTGIWRIVLRRVLD